MANNIVSGVLGIKHSGQLGDIMYSLPAARRIIKKYSFESAIYFVPSDTRLASGGAVKHFGGEAMITIEMLDFIKPLLMEQKYVRDVIFAPRQNIPQNVVDFDIFRSCGVNTAAGDIRDYFFKGLGLVSYDEGPWLEVDCFGGHDDGGVVISRSKRYINNSINYDCLGQVCRNIRFLGTVDEFEYFRALYPGLIVSHAPTRSALQAAEIISRADLFVGNQSLFFAIAEALQVTRLLESFEPVPNVTPRGGVHGSFMDTQSLLAMSAEILGVEANLALNQNSESNYIFSA